MKNQKTFSQKAINFLFNLQPAINLPQNVQVMNPYENEKAKLCVKNFFEKFYNDQNKRIFILGINPGRFGGGLTGISFTDPFALENFCGIKNDIEKVRELSSKFVYEVINAYGGAQKFYSKFFVSAIYPLALIQNGKNYNYYDDKETVNFLQPDILKYLKDQIDFGAEKKAVICLGKKNETFLKNFNSELNYFEEIITLEHPRFIMQYKSKTIEQYVEKYLSVMNKF